MLITPKRLYLIPEYWIMFIASYRKSITLEFEINWCIMISHIGHVLYSLNPLCYNVSMVHGNQRNTDTTQSPNIRCPHPSTVDDIVCFDGTTRSLHSWDMFNSKVIDFSLNACNRTVLKYLEVKQVKSDYNVYNINWGEEGK